MRFFKILNFAFLIIISFYLIDCASTQQADRFSKTKDQTEQEKDLTVDQSQPDTLKRVEVKVPDEVKEVKKAESQITAKKDSVKAEANLIESPNSAFAVQLGAFREIKNVEKFEKMVKKDFPAVTIRTEYDGETQTYKVTGGQFPNKEEAYKFRTYCVDKGYKDSWVITVPK
jgi:septal ring-binding cell division protein DamX